jgi:two-component system, cell cycle sensor histidine kinase and response regulator CckA
MLVPEDRGRAQENFAKRQTGEDVGTVEYKALRKDGSLLYTLFHPNAIIKDGKLSGFRGVIIDITERKQLEEETLRQERLAAVGQLAAGIAHDFNNLLTSMIGFAELVQHRYDLPDKAKSDLARIAKQGLRAAKLTRQILDFSRQTINEPQPLDLNIYLNETLKFIERTIPENIEIRFNFGRGDHTINADPTQLQQVITNLAVNARDAMPGGGMLTFTLSRTTLTPDEPLPCSDMEAGEWVKLGVTDTGEGIAPEILGHIFEPFFTTKEIGQGTGLGLAQIYGIVQQHGGCITVDSRVGQGSTFTFYFAALTSEVSAANKAVEALTKGQGQTILLVEDEQVVREVAQAMLEMLNYRVLAAKNGEEGLTLYRAQADQIALVLTDAMMPKMDGFALALALQKEAPHLNVVLMTGYARDTEVQAGTIQNIVNRLQKPLNLHQLADAMQQALA